MPNLKSQIAVVVVVLGLAVIAGFLWGKRPASTIEPNTASTTISLAIDQSADSTTSTSTTPYKVEYYPIPQNKEELASSTAPSLTRQIRFSSDTSPEVKGILVQNIATLRDSLSKNYVNFSGWMNLAIQYKTAGDYEGAKEVWEYISKLYSNSSIPLHNLGDLYQHHLTDFAKAESYYKRSIAMDSTQAIDYLALFDLYRYSYKQDTTLAVDILKTGIEHVKGNQVIDLYSTLGSYYKDKNDVANAILYYTKERDAAEKEGNSALVAELDTVLSELQK
ncbi:MAG: hypothetical protein Q7S75_01930 [bacterium]|nr:hypothetical protein [bacterium]